LKEKSLVCDNYVSMVAAAEATSMISVPVFVRVMIELTFTIY
jgi:hypothetical protein